MELSAPKVTAIVDADFSKRLHPVYRKVSVSLNEDITAKAELKFSSKGVGSEKIYVGHVSTYLGDGLYTDVVCYLNVSADGKATIQYKLTNTLTASYINGDFRISEDSNGSWEGTKAEVNGQLLGEPQLNLRFFGYWFDEKLYGSIDIVGVQADIGPKLKATATVHDTEPKLCTNLDLYGYASIGVNTDFGIGKWLKNHTRITLTKVILDNNTANPLRGTWHYEDGKRTEGDKCTYKKAGTETTNKNNKEKNDLAIEAYKKFYKKNLSKECDFYFFADLNNDELKEMIAVSISARAAMYIYTYYNDEVVKCMDGFFNDLGVVENKKYFAGYGSGGAAYSAIYLCELKNGKVNIIDTYDYDDGVCTKNGKKISEEEYINFDKSIDWNKYDSYKMYINFMRQNTYRSRYTLL